MTPEQYAAYEHRIRGLSVAIWIAQRQSLPLGIPPKEPATLRIYRAIATLLTTNPKEEGVITATGTPVTGVRIPGAPLNGLTVIAPFPDSSLRGKPTLLVEKISIPDRHSRATQEDPECPRPEPNDIVRHSTEIFQNLQYLSQTRVLRSEGLIERAEFESQSLKITRFVLSRCWKAVKTRLDAGRFLLAYQGSATTLGKILKGWSPRHGDRLTSPEPWVSVNDRYLAHLLQHERVPRRNSNNEDSMYFGTEYASGWMKTLGKMIEDLHNATDRYASNHSSNDLAMMATNMRSLTHLLNSVPIRTIFESQSLQSQFDMLRKRKTDFSITVEPTRTLLEIIEDERRLNEAAGHHVFRYLLSLVKWYRAATTDLPDLLAKFAHTSLVCDVVKVPFPVIQPQRRLKMHSPLFVARERLHSFLSASNIEHPYSQNDARSLYALLDEVFAPRSSSASCRTPSPKPDGIPLEEFPGNFHSLAISLSVVSGDSASSSPDATSPNWRLHVAGQMYPLTRSKPDPPTNDFVTPSEWGYSTSFKRCCYCCSLLDEILSSIQKGASGLDIISDLTVPLKNHYGVFVPWTPPPLGYGLGHKTLALLEQTLGAILLESILQLMDSKGLATGNKPRFDSMEGNVSSRGSHLGSSQNRQSAVHSSRLSGLPTIFESSSNHGRSIHNYPP
ncbi:hypothetical protein EV360DRAFT_78576 [Lentinula raphanica]|nr:hypothetical protein EV360DRAFT_78576 [Lentinula raphanica]